jgi:dTDP-4-amino-4,6-dideoxygalactose transaminase
VPSSCEGQLSELFGYDHVVLFGRGRAGLVAVLEEIGGPTAPVLIPSNICVAVLAAVAAAGKRAQLVAVSPLSGLAEDESLAVALQKTQARFGVVMPTHLYGMWADYPLSRQAALERGWFVLENDSLAASIGLKRRSSSDALLLSFGSGKTIDAGGSGAILTNDPVLAKALKRRAKGWPIFSETTDPTENNLVLARRYLHALGRGEAGETLLDIDVAYCRNRFDELQRENISKALVTFPQENGARLARLENWQAALHKLAPDIALPEIPIRTPWRAVFRFRQPDQREIVVQALRRHGIDAGTNYPPLRDFFPNLLKDQAFANAQHWGETVLTLWLSSAYGKSKIAAAVTIIESAIGDGPR